MKQPAAIPFSALRPAFRRPASLPGIKPFLKACKTAPPSEQESGAAHAGLHARL